MTDQNLASFVKEQRAAGASEIQIYGQLKQAGWQDQDIAQAMGAQIPAGLPPIAAVGYEAGRSFTRDDASTRAVIRDFAIYGAISTIVYTVGGYLSGAVLGSEFAYAFRRFPGASQFLKTDLHLVSDAVTLVISVLAYGFLGYIFSRYSQPLLDAVGRYSGGHFRSVFSVLFWPASTYNIVASIVGGFVILVAMPIFVIPLLVDSGFRIAGNLIFALGASRSMKRNLGVDRWVDRA